MVDTVEALAARRAILFAYEKGLCSIVIEGDSTGIVAALTNPYIIEDIKMVANQFILTCLFNHVKRQSNGVSHALARKAQHCNDFYVLLEEVPPDIVSALHKDFAF
ncbi:putative ribonuclease h protein [Fagus crenata]